MKGFGMFLGSKLGDSSVGKVPVMQAPALSHITKTLGKARSRRYLHLSVLTVLGEEADLGLLGNRSDLIGELQVN